MPKPTEFSFTRYLAAKKSVDDRALNRHVWELLATEIASARSAEPHRVLEIGAGIGTMIERAVDWNLFPFGAAYTAIDEIIENIEEARGRLAQRRLPERLQVTLEAADVFEFVERDQWGKWDLVIAHAFLDLLNLPSALPDILSLLKRGGLLYFTINFDGVTIFEPPVDPDFDDLVIRLYHRTMDERITKGQASGDSRTGRHLFDHFHKAGATIAAAGSSDWIVFPGAEGYPEDEAYFLHFIIHTMYGALKEHSELDEAQFSRWIEQRHDQVERNELIYIAHQIDFFGQKSE